MPHFSALTCLSFQSESPSDWSAGCSLYPPHLHHHQDSYSDFLSSVPCDADSMCSSSDSLSFWALVEFIHQEPLKRSESAGRQSKVGVYLPRLLLCFSTRFCHWQHLVPLDYSSCQVAPSLCFSSPTLHYFRARGGNDIITAPPPWVTLRHLLLALLTQPIPLYLTYETSFRIPSEHTLFNARIQTEMVAKALQHDED